MSKTADGTVQTTLNELPGIETAASDAPPREDVESAVTGDAGEDTAECSHLAEYRVDGDCLRCEQARTEDQDRQVRRGTVADSGINNRRGLR